MTLSFRADDSRDYAGERRIRVAEAGDHVPSASVYVEVIGRYGDPESHVFLSSGDAQALAEAILDHVSADSRALAKTAGIKAEPLPLSAYAPGDRIVVADALAPDDEYHGGATVVSVTPNFIRAYLDDEGRHRRVWGTAPALLFPGECEPMPADRDPAPQPTIVPGFVPGDVVVTEADAVRVVASVYEPCGTPECGWEACQAPHYHLDTLAGAWEDTPRAESSLRLLSELA